MNKQMINSITLSLEIELADSETCDLLYEALELESGYNPNERATANLMKKVDKLVVQIIAKDAVSAREAINSYMKWINLSLQVVDISSVE